MVLRLKKHKTIQFVLIATEFYLENFEFVQTFIYRALKYSCVYYYYLLFEKTYPRSNASIRIISFVYVFNF